MQQTAKFSVGLSVSLLRNSASPAFSMVFSSSLCLLGFLCHAQRLHIEGFASLLQQSRAGNGATSEKLGLLITACYMVSFFKGSEGF